MPYITSTELLARYRILEKWGLDPTQISSDLIFYAESELNSRLASAFTVPFSAAHPTIKDLTMDLSYCKALETKDLKRWEARYKIVTDRITDIKEGRAFIVTGSGTLLASPTRSARDRRALLGEEGRSFF